MYFSNREPYEVFPVLVRSMSEEKRKKDGMENEPIYDECDECGEMLVITQCQKCRKWICNRCWGKHYC